MCLNFETSWFCQDELCFFKTSCFHQDKLTFFKMSCVFSDELIFQVELVFPKILIVAFLVQSKKKGGGGSILSTVSRLHILDCTVVNLVDLLFSS